MQTQTEISYRIAAVDSASPIGMLLALYDTLSGNLARASSAIRAHDIERRCAELNHAYAVLGHLESWVEQERHDPLAESLRQFYSYLRAKMLEASLKQSAPMLNAALDLVLMIRTTWQQREAMTPAELDAHAAAFASGSREGHVASRPLSQTV